MGLLDSLVNVPERLRVWQLSGVRYFYLAEAAGAAAQPDAPAPAADPADWPGPWAAILAKAPRSPRLVITYAALGLDLTGRAEARRSGLWRALIRDLGLAGRNLVAFWPMTLPGDDAGPDRFLAGLRALAPSRVAFFGPALPGIPLLPGQTPADATLDGMPCAILPDPDTLLAGDKEVWDHVLAVLGPA